MVDKDAGWTSHDVVARARKVLGTRRVGHAGTLDPGATGVLVLGVGRVTRVLRFLSALPKSYVGEIVLGVETTTLDDQGEVVARHDMAHVGPEDVARAATGLVGHIEQVPPMVSAVSVGGRRLHELAREGIEVERAARPVTVHRFDVTPVPGAPGVYRAEVECSSGTYVRVLAADLGAALGGGAHLRALRRTAVGSFTLAEARPVDAVELLAPATALRDYPSLVVDDELAVAVGHGKVLPRTAFGLPDGVVVPTRPAGALPSPVDPREGPWAVLDRHGALLAVYQCHRDATVKPAMVLPPPDQA